MDDFKKHVRENWNRHAENYDDQYQHGLKSKEEKQAWLVLLHELIPERARHILDVGAGTGFLTLLLCELGHTVKSVDLSPGMLAEAKRKAQAAGYTDCVEFSEGDAENLVEPDEQYDVVINRHLLWAMPHPEQAINEWKRVLKPGGQLIIIDGDWHYNLPMNNFKIILGKLLALFVRHENMFKQPHFSTGEQMPMTIPENAKAAPEYVRKAGFKVTVRCAAEIEEAERKAMPLCDRLLNPYHRIIIIGEKI